MKNIFSQTPSFVRTLIAVVLLVFIGAVGVALVTDITSPDSAFAFFQSNDICCTVTVFDGGGFGGWGGGWDTHVGCIQTLTWSAI
jgi:hypothetical protein